MSNPQPDRSNVIRHPSAPDLSSQIGPQPTKKEKKQLPKILITDRQLSDIVVEAWAAVLANPKIKEKLYVTERGIHLLVETDTSVELRPLTNDHMYGLLLRSARWMKLRPAQRGEETAGPFVEKNTEPPDKVARDMLVYPSDKIRKLRSVFYAPVVTPRGPLVKYGYDKDEATYIAFRRATDIKPMPVTEAAAFLQHWLCDFPFIAKHDYAHAIALFLLPMVRPLIKGPTPFHLIEAPTSGTGKGFLAKTLALAGRGKMPAMRPWGDENEEERRKVITTVIRNSDPVCIFDNVRGRISSTSLEAVITSDVWADRMMTTMQSVELPNLTTWMATGNNASANADMARRTLRILIARYDSTWRPKTHAVHSDIVGWTHDNLPKILSAGLSLVLHWLDKGALPFSGATLGSFESWSDVIGGILEAAGIEGFLEGRTEWEANSEYDSAGWAELWVRWERRYGTGEVEMGELLGLLNMEPEILCDVTKAGESDRTRKSILGRQLTKKRDSMILGKYKLSTRNINGVARWTLKVVDGIAR